MNLKHDLSFESEYLNPIAEINHIDSAKFATPLEAKTLKDVESDIKFFCPDSLRLDESRILILSRSKNNNYFFRHRGDYAHNIQPETILHKLAIKWFEGLTEYEIPSIYFDDFVATKQVIKLDHTRTQCEYNLSKVLIPDVMLNTQEGLQFAIEIVVTNDLSESKKEKIDKLGVPFIRVDLSKFYASNINECRNDKDFVLKSLPDLMTELSIKSWAMSPTFESITGKIVLNERIKQVGSPGGCIITFFTLGSYELIQWIIKTIN